MPAKPTTRQETEANILVSAAEVIGTAAGQIASSKCAALILWYSIE
jgi:hypothetical protein